jgi:hypothetical protein
MKKRYKIVALGEILRDKDIVCDSIQIRNQYINQIEKYGMFKIERPVISIFTRIAGNKININRMIYLRLLVPFDLIDNGKCNIIKLKKEV